MIYKRSIKQFFKGDPTLTLYWPLYNSSIDYSGKSNHGTHFDIIYTPVVSKSRIGLGAYFNGSSSYIQRASPVSGLNAATLMLWVNVKSFPQFINEIGGLGNDGINGSFFFYVYSTPKFTGFIRTSNGTLVTAGEYYSVSFNKWYHLAMTYNGTRAFFYLNGNLINSATTSGTIGGVPFLLGQTTTSGYNYWFNGNIYEVGLWTRVLSPAEISAYYKWVVSSKKYFVFTAPSVINTRRRLLLSM